MSAALACLLVTSVGYPVAYLAGYLHRAAVEKLRATKPAPRRRRGAQVVPVAALTAKQDATRGTIYNGVAAVRP